MANVELDLCAKERSAGINQQDCSAHSVGWKLPHDCDCEMEQLKQQAAKKPKQLIESYLAVQGQGLEPMATNKTLESENQRLQQTNKEHK